jgi:sialic acid synthase
VREITINGKCFSDETTPYLIAEVGHNHQGNLDTAIQLIREAAKSGANAVKFQKRSNRTLYTKEAFDAPYVNDNSYGDTYGSHREALEFGKSEYLACKAEAEALGIDFFATAFDFESADFLAELNVPAFKIASGDLKSIPLIEYVASFGKPLILSTGGGSMEDVIRGVTAAKEKNCPVAVLQCTAGYPPKFEELNLKVIETFRNQFPDVTVGYSGHDSGIAMSLVAYLLGARVIEKHFTLNRALKGTDHSFSLEPQGMSKLVRDIQRANAALGDGVKGPYPSENKPLLKMGKSLYYRSSFRRGHHIERADLVLKSPGGGIPPFELNNFIGKQLHQDVIEEQLVSGDHFLE